MRRFGVSPAFVMSRHGTAFSTGDYCASIEALRELGFEAFQPEIYYTEKLPEWESGVAAVAATAVRAGVHTSQFVAHFLLEHFASARSLADHSDLALLERALRCAQAFEDCKVFCVPLAPYKWAPDDPPYPRVRQLAIDKLRAYCERINSAGFRCAVEILPFSIVGNSDGFLRFAAEIDSADFGVNLDTGHAWASRELITLLPEKLAGRVFGLHLKDNSSDINEPLAPGRGTIPWGPFLANLSGSGYSGSLDLEIRCAPERVAEEYAAGRDVLSRAASHSPE